MQNVIQILLSLNASKNYTADAWKSKHNYILYSRRW